MAKKQGVNKSQAVREFLKAHPRVKNTAVAEALAKQGVDVSPTYVATIKSKSKKRRRAVRAVVAKRGVSITEIKAAFAFLKACGGPAAAKEALAAAEEIRAMM